MSQATCGGCGAPIVWGVTEAGKKVPLDPPEGRFVARSLMPEGPGEDLVVEMRTTWLSHFATCPDHDDFRRPS